MENRARLRERSQTKWNLKIPYLSESEASEFRRHRQTGVISVFKCSACATCGGEIPKVIADEHTEKAGCSVPQGEPIKRFCSKKCWKSRQEEQNDEDA